MKDKPFDPSTVSERQTSDLTHEEIAARAYRCWQERGSAPGSAEADWQQAEQELRAEKEDTQKAHKTSSGK